MHPHFQAACKAVNATTWHLDSLVLSFVAADLAATSQLNWCSVAVIHQLRSFIIYNLNYKICYDFFSRFQAAGRAATRQLRYDVNNLINNAASDMSVHWNKTNR